MSSFCGGLPKKIIAIITLALCLALLSFELLQVKHSLASQLGLPEPNILLHSSPSYDMPVIAGIKFDRENPLSFSFLINTGNAADLGLDEARRLIDYFNLALTIPDDELWVNLSPHEQDRILPELLQGTVLGHDMLAQDYILKQFSASLTYPENEIGKEYWKEFGRSISKVWIAPKESEVQVKDGLVVISKASLRVLSEEDYIAARIGKRKVNTKSLEHIEEEVNSGKHFARLRQLYRAVILAKWFKQTLKNSVFEDYFDKGLTSGLSTESKTYMKSVFNLYTRSYSKGVYEIHLKEKGKSKKQYSSGGIVPFPNQVNEKAFDDKDLKVALGKRPKVVKSYGSFELAESSAVLYDDGIDHMAENFIPNFKNKLLNVAMELKRKREEYNLSAEKKEDNTIVTQADYDVQNAMLNFYMAEMPYAYLIFEEQIKDESLKKRVQEHNQRNRSSEWVIYLDPIDGTKPFASSKMTWVLGATSIFYKDRQVLAMGYAPDLYVKGLEEIPQGGVLFQAFVADNKTLVNGREVRVKNVDNIDNEIIQLHSEPDVLVDNKAVGWDYVQPDWQEKLAPHLADVRLNTQAASAWCYSLMVAMAGTYSNNDFPAMHIVGGVRKRDLGSAYLIELAGGKALRHNGEHIFAGHDSHKEQVLPSFVMGAPSAVDDFLARYKESLGGEQKIPKVSILDEDKLSSNVYADLNGGIDLALSDLNLELDNSFSKIFSTLKQEGTREFRITIESVENFYYKDKGN